MIKKCYKPLSQRPRSEVIQIKRHKSVQITWCCLLRKDTSFPGNISYWDAARVHSLGGRDLGVGRPLGGGLCR